MKIKKIKADSVKSVLYPLIFGALVILLWQTQVIHGWFGADTFTLPLPSRILQILFDNFGKMTGDIRATVTVALGGLFLGSLLGFLLAMVATINATKIYRGNSTYVGNVVYTWDGKHLYQGNSTYMGNILYTWDGKHLYQGNSTYMGNIIYTWDGKYIYQGNSTYMGNILYTWNGKNMFQGNTTYTGNILCTWDGKHVYNGNTTYIGNITYTVDGPIPPVIISLLL